MYIAMIASECTPVVKVGGLADVIYGLSKNLEQHGATVEILLPKYDCLSYDQIAHLTLQYKDLWVPWNNAGVRCSVWQGSVHGRTCFFIEPHSNDNFFSRRTVYGCPDDGMRFAFFCKAALEFLFKSGRRPDIIHCHDWMTGLIPVMLFELYQSNRMENTRVCLTIHNFRHQGIVGENILQATGLGRPEYYFRTESLRDVSNPRALNLMKAGIVYSNFITTVSPQYAWEAKNTEHGCGLGPLLTRYENKFEGILNGIDYESWNPETDGFIPRRYTVGTIEDKKYNKEAMYGRLGIRKDHKPIIAFIGRLDEQKGIPLIRHALSYAILHGAQFVLLGTGADAAINREFTALQKQFDNHPDCRLVLRYDENLSHLIYAGADMIVMPSLFEPCGLTQVIGLRYGTVPIVREVGGLVDTVFDWNYSDRPLDQRNGFSFKHTDANAVESALYRALDLWYNHPQDFSTLMRNGMRCNFSWDISGKKYMEIYKRISVRR